MPIYSPNAYPRLSTRYVPGVGPQPCPVMILGEGPGKQETRQLQPFVGPAGQLLTDILERQGLQRSACYLTCIVKRQVVDDKEPTEDELALFRPDVLKELEQTQPTLVITAGGAAARFMLGDDFNLELNHGLLQRSEEFNVLVMPCYSPGMGLHDSDAMAAVYWDYQRAVRASEGLLREHEAEEVDTWVHQPAGMPLMPPHGDFAVDTEDLVNGSPWCATVSWEPGHAVFIRPTDYDCLDRLSRWFATPGLTAYIHHTMHDLEPLRKLGVVVPASGFDWPHTTGCRIVDTIVLAFEQGKIHTQALKTLAYRLLQVRMTSYGEVVDPVARRRESDYLAEAFLEPDDSWIAPEPEASWDEEKGVLKITKPQGLPQRLKRLMADLAKKPETNLAERWSKIPDLLRAQVVARLGPFPQTDLSHCDLTAATHYACQDADMTLRLGRELMDRHRVLDLDRIASIDHGQIPMVEQMQANGMPVVPEELQSLAVEMREMQAGIADCLSTILGRPVNPNSSGQVAELLYQEMGLTPAKMLKSGKASTGKKALQHLRASNPLVDLIMGSREYGKNDGFCGSILEHSRQIEDYQTDGGIWLSEHRAFYELMVTRAKTGRLASKKFNVLAIPVRTKLGRRIRSAFKARPGRLLGTWDLNQIEMRVMAHRAADKVMLDIYNRDAWRYPAYERDLHIMTAATVFGVKPQDVKKDQRTACKSTGFGIIMGITGIGLADQMRMYGLPEEDWPEDRCDELIRDWLRVYRGVNDYQLMKRAEARRYGEIRDMYGRRHPLPHANCPLSWVREEALRQSHALDIQGSAQAIEKLCMARFWRECQPTLEAMGYCQPLVQIHDELLYEFDQDLANLIDALMLHVLTTTVTLSLPIEAGGAIGQSWADLEK